MDEKSNGNLEILSQEILRAKGIRTFDCGRPLGDVEHDLRVFYAAQVMASGNMPQALPFDRIASVARWMCGAGKPGLILYGGYGTGKTTMLEAVKYVMDCRCNATASRIYTTEKFLPVAEADGKNLFGLLIIDELGREPDVVKDYGNEKRPMAEMICWREKRAMPLLAATNLTEDELRSKYGEYVYDRLRSLCNRVFFDGESFRK